MKIIFAGTPEFAVPTLQLLIDSQHDVLAVYTQPDRPAGRGQQLRASPIKQLAQANNIAVLQPNHLKDASVVNQLGNLQAELMVVVAYGLILPAAVLSIPTHGCLNVHASLLPRWRGAAPIQRALLAGDSRSGICVMQMDEGLDTGDVLMQHEVPLSTATTAAELHDELARIGASGLLQVVNQISAGQPPQAHEQDAAMATYANKLSKSEAKIDWCAPAEQVLRQIKAFNPWPVAQTTWAGKTLRVWDADAYSPGVDLIPGTLSLSQDNLAIVACGQGALTILEVQPAGKKRMPIAAYLNAKKADVARGVVLGL